ncbi:MAG: tRNA 2-thiocytidine biosynthesis protein TtcA [Yoonia sp.]|jgi:tRNA 2-thiocytidine biosynthesis protein TtcA
MLDNKADIHRLFNGPPSTIAFKKLRKRIARHAREAIEQYGYGTRIA